MSTTSPIPHDSNSSTASPVSSAQPSTSTSTTTTIPQSTLASLHAYPFTTDTAFLAGLSQILGHPGTPATAEELLQKPDLVLSAKCFYFSRKFQTPVPISPTAYKTWLTSQAQTSSVGDGTGAAATSRSDRESIPALEGLTIREREPASAMLPAPVSVTEGSSQTQTQSQPQQQQQQPPYPISFAAIVDLITNNKPIPGIEEIPDTVLELGSSKQDRATRRKKPWETDASDTITSSKIDTNRTESVDIGTATISSVSDQTQTESDARSVTEQSEGLLRLLRPEAVPDSGLVAKE